MPLKKMSAVLGTALILAACQGGTPETETTGDAQSVQQTGTRTATTTGSTGGTVSNMADADKEFVAKAGMGGLAEVQMGTLASQKATSADVKAFAQRMVTDHGKANEELQQLATAKGLALPTELAGEHKAGYDHLNMLSGAEFDKAYMQHMVADHDKDVTEFQNASQTATDTDVKAFAAKTLPVLQDHQQAAKDTQAKVQ